MLIIKPPDKGLLSLGSPLSISCENSVYFPSSLRACSGLLFYINHRQKEWCILLDQTLKLYLRPVMQRFSCNEKVAEAIIQSSKNNGELNGIVNMCKQEIKGRSES